MLSSADRNISRGIADPEFERFAIGVVAYLVSVGVVAADSPILPLLQDLFTERPATVESFAAFVGCKAKTVRDRFSEAGLGAELRSWTVIARALPIIDRLQCGPSTSVQVAATEEGYASAFKFSDELNAHLGMRPAAARKLETWHDVVDVFLRARKISPDTSRLAPSLDQESPVVVNGPVERPLTEVDRERARVLKKREEEWLAVKARQLLTITGPGVDRRELLRTAIACSEPREVRPAGYQARAEAAQRCLTYKSPIERRKVVARALKLRDDASIWGKRIDPATTTVKPFDHRDEGVPRAGKKKRAAHMNYDFTAGTRRGHETQAAQRATQKKEATMPKQSENVKAGRNSGEAKAQRDRVREWLTIWRAAHPELKAKDGMKAANAHFGVDIQKENWYATYWKPTSDAAATPKPASKPARAAAPRSKPTPQPKTVESEAAKPTMPVTIGTPSASTFFVTQGVPQQHALDPSSETLPCFSMTPVVIGDRTLMRVQLYATIDPDDTGVIASLIAAGLVRTATKATA